MDSLGFVKIKNYILNDMDPHANFQRIMLQLLIKHERDNPTRKGVVTKETIDEHIQKENPDKDKGFVSTDVYSTLVDKHKIVLKHIGRLSTPSGKGYKLNIDTPLSTDEIDLLSDLLRDCIVLVGPEENWKIALGSSGKDQIGIWGSMDIEPTNVAHWKKAKSDDNVIFYRSKTKSKSQVQSGTTNYPFISEDQVKKIVEKGKEIEQKNWTRQQIINAGFSRKDWNSEDFGGKNYLNKLIYGSEDEKYEMVKVIQNHLDSVAPPAELENGVFGIGQITEKFQITDKDDKKHIIFADEKRVGHVLYPKRIRFKVIHTSTTDVLRGEEVPGLPIAKGMVRIGDRSTKDKLLAKLSKTWGKKLTNHTRLTPGSAPGNDPGYLMLRSNSNPNKNKYNNEMGKRYFFKSGTPNGSLVQPGTKTIWFESVDKVIYIWGFGIVSKVSPIVKNDETTGEPYKWNAVEMDDFYILDQSGTPGQLGEAPTQAEFKLSTDVQNKLDHDYPYNIQDPIIRIDQKMYDIITGGGEGWPTDPATIGLELPSTDKISKFKEEIANKLLIESSVIDKIISSLYAGKHILLTGPVGTGKTHLATLLPNVVWNYFTDVHTATADWTTQDVIGGPYPKTDDGKMKFLINPGCVTKTITQNWSNKTGVRGTRISSTHIDPETKKEKKFNGVWLVIDEFNRAYIDRAFGELFTALEYKNLKVPSTKPGVPHDDYTIPADYRIIGTLNSFDKHFLFQLSDALKRRFDFIEISAPDRTKTKEEKEIAIRKALALIPNGKAFDSQVQDLNDTVDTLQEILAFIRTRKQLGTAVLISMIQDMLVYGKMGKGQSECLDAALVKKIIPQLESLPASTIQAILLFVRNDFANFYITFDWNKRREQSQEYAAELKNFCKYMNKFDINIQTSEWSKEFLQEKFVTLNKKDGMSESDKQTKASLIEDLKFPDFNPTIPEFKASLRKLLGEKEFSGMESIGTE